MPQCKRCQAPILWQRGSLPGPAWIALEPQTRKPHTCSAPKTCRYCQKPIVWKELEGKRQCFELDEKTLHNDACTNRDECAHCGQKVCWTLVEGKWLALDSVMTRELHWSLCPKNADAAKALVIRLATLEEENARLRQLLPGAPQVSGAAGNPRGEVAHLQAEITRLQREMAYRDLELRRLTAKAEGRTRKRA